jgi:hypothetical protein
MMAMRTVDTYLNRRPTRADLTAAVRDAAARGRVLGVKRVYGGAGFWRVRVHFDPYLDEDLLHDTPTELERWR